jgi:hypothetical protein
MLLLLLLLLLLPATVTVRRASALGTGYKVQATSYTKYKVHGTTYKVEAMVVTVTVTSGLQHGRNGGSSQNHRQDSGCRWLWGCGCGCDCDCGSGFCGEAQDKARRAISTYCRCFFNFFYIWTTISPNTMGVSPHRVLPTCAHTTTTSLQVPNQIEELRVCIL